MFFLPCVELLMSDDFLSSFPCTPFARIDPLNVSYYIENIFTILSWILDPQYSQFVRLTQQH